MSVEKAKRIEEDNLAVYTTDEFRRHTFNLEAEPGKPPAPALPAYDWSVVWSRPLFVRRTHVDSAQNFSPPKE